MRNSADLHGRLLIAIKNEDRDVGLTEIKGVLSWNELSFEEKADFINHQDENGETALHHAVREGNMAAIELLYFSGADFNLENNAREAAWDIADWSTRKFFLWQGLLDAIKNEERDVGLTEIKDVLSWNKLSLEEKVDLINHQDENGDTLLHHAAREGNSAAVKLLDLKGADLKVKNNSGETVLDVVKSKDEGIFDFLRAWQEVENFLQQKRVDLRSEEFSRSSVLQILLEDFLKFTDNKGSEAAEIQSYGADLSDPAKTLLVATICGEEVKLMSYKVADVKEVQKFLLLRLTDECIEPGGDGSQQLFCDRDYTPMRAKDIKEALGTLLLVFEELEKEMMSNKDANYLSRGGTKRPADNVSNGSSAKCSKMSNGMVSHPSAYIEQLNTSTNSQYR